MIWTSWDSKNNMIILPEISWISDFQVSRGIGFRAGVKAIKYSVNIAIIFFYIDNVTRLALCEEGMIQPSCRSCTGFFDELQEVII